jgi:hypothetical protein
MRTIRPRLGWQPLGKMAGITSSYSVMPLQTTRHDVKGMLVRWVALDAAEHRGAGDV